jgi:hypothetical protein
MMTMTSAMALSGVFRHPDCHDRSERLLRTRLMGEFVGMTANRQLTL